jgi:hypothetical protein
MGCGGLLKSSQNRNYPFAPTRPNVRAGLARPRDANQDYSGEASVEHRARVADCWRQNTLAQ